MAKVLIEVILSVLISFSCAVVRVHQNQVEKSDQVRSSTSTIKSQIRISIIPSTSQDI